MQFSKSDYLDVCTNVHVSIVIIRHCIVKRIKNKLTEKILKMWQIGQQMLLSFSLCCTDFSSTVGMRCIKATKY